MLRLLDRLAKAHHLKKIRLGVSPVKDVSVERFLFWPQHPELETGGMRTKGFFKSSAPDRPVVSVITVVFNGAKYLERAIQSVSGQSYNRVEYILIDGGSKDETISIISQYENQIDYWISEPDDGIYDAMNKGISLATGDWLVFMGSDDYLAHPGVIQECIDQFLCDRLSRVTTPVLIYGDVVYSNGYHFKSAFDSRILLHNTIHHQAALYSRSLFDHFRYDVAFDMIADYELNLLIYLREYPTLSIGKTISICQVDGGSSGLANRRRNIQELDAIRRRYVPFVIHLCMSAVVHTKTFVRLIKPWA